MKKIYETHVAIEGGREGKARSEDGRLNLEFSPPGSSGQGTNPEQLFAAGYGACFESAVRHVAKLKKISLKSVNVNSKVELFQVDDGSFELGVTLLISIPEVESSVAKDLLDTADKVCPYSKALRGTAKVEIGLS